MSSRFVDYSESGPNLLGTSATAPARKIQATFRFKNTDVTTANTLRRVLLTHTQSVGFRTEPYEKSDVEISINTTPLVNEMIAHRIGMIPIYADPNTFDVSLYEFHLDKENSTKEIIDVRASDFRVYKKSISNPLEDVVEIPASEFFPPDPITGDTVLITRLRPQWNPTANNERLKLKARASISNGKENIRWSPVCQVSYEYTPNTDPIHIQSVFANWLLNNKKIDDQSKLSDEKRDELMREFKTMEIQRCYLRNEKNEPNDFTFHMESVGIQSIPFIVSAGLKECETLVSNYKDCDTNLPANVKFQVGDSRFPSIDVVFQNEDHTLGNLLETCIVNTHIDGSESPKINYVGYKVPHPLRPEMFVRMDTRTKAEVNGNISVSVEQQIERSKRVLANVCRNIMREFQVLQVEWNTLTA